ncbi:hypothetical protein [Ferrimonas balearica]|uniref:hypothetical protein n=1 Tax=Ferrimonas balearica TaxID=44012 RepID=UPI001C9A0D91|nr:hypothetical protein [Ferrimonas balearica]MBY5992273.1 hypothetical protein [Ferrimonas balearica]
MRPVILILLLAGCAGSLPPEQAEQHQARMAAEAAALQGANRTLDSQGQPQAVGGECRTHIGQHCPLWGDSPVGVPCRCGDEAGVVQ